MKCTQCGCNSFNKVKLLDVYASILASYGEVEVDELVDAYACKKCGHIELFVSKQNDDENK